MSRVEAARRSGYSDTYALEPGRIERNERVREAIEEWLKREGLSDDQLGVAAGINDEERKRDVSTRRSQGRGDQLPEVRTSTISAQS
jgi:hypothetical protein